VTPVVETKTRWNARDCLIVNLPVVATARTIALYRRHRRLAACTSVRRGAGQVEHGSGTYAVGKGDVFVLLQRSERVFFGLAGSERVWRLHCRIEIAGIQRMEA